MFLVHNWNLSFESKIFNKIKEAAKIDNDEMSKLKELFDYIIIDEAHHYDKVMILQ